MLAVACLVFAQVCASVLIPPGFALAVFSDVTQCILLLSGVAALLPNIVRNHGRTRIFWALMTLGVAFWLCYQLLWTYFEVVLRQDVPDPFVGDIIIFLHLVPMMAALALRPHAMENDYTARLGRMDFVLLLTWWVYLYCFAVLPWQYAHVDEASYGRSLNTLYLTEKLVFLTALAVVWLRSKRGWRLIYAHLFGASLLYAVSSYVANWAIQRNSYYSGSLYDLPVAASMAWVSWVGVVGQETNGKRERTQPTRRHGVWLARVGMIVIFSLPVFAAWSLFDSDAPDSVRRFRLVLTLATIMVMGGLVFVRQHLLDRELVRLLSSSRESFENLKQLQTQLIQSEKLASLGQLIGGAAHELNNPLTAMLGYSELLATSGLDAEQSSLANNIAQQVRHTRVLISNLLNFARQSPGEKTRVDVNTVILTAAKLCQPQAEDSRVAIRTTLGDPMPPIMADRNQLLQVFLHLATSCSQLLEESGGGTLMITSRGEATRVTIDFRQVTSAISTKKPGRPGGLGLSACYGIIQQHEGRIQSGSQATGDYTVSIDLPVAPPVVQSTSDFNLRVPADRMPNVTLSR
jgi:signal transduction histidine kinase